MTATLTIDNPAYFDRLAEVEAAHWWSLGMWRLASRWIRGATRGRTGLEALDVGCGTGLTMRRLSALPGVESVVGLDPSAEALAHARTRHDFPLVRGSALDLPFDDGAFDVVTCFDVLQHVPVGEDLRAVSELRRVLRPGGIALVRSNARGRRTPPPGSGICYRLDELVAVIERSGLVVRRASLANALPALAQEVRGRMAGSSRGGPAHPSGGGLRIRVPHPAVNRLLGVVSAAEAALAGRCGVGLPFGHSTMILAGREP